MNAEISWVIAGLPEVAAPDADTTAWARDELMRHLSLGAPGPAPAPARRRSRWRPARSWLLLCTAVSAAGATAGVLLLGPSGNGALRTVDPAQAAAIKAAARRALTPPGTVFELDEVTTVTHTIGATTTTGYHGWFQTSAPYAYRIIQSAPGVAVPGEMSTTPAGRQELYDPTTNTIYVYDLHLTFGQGPRPGTRVLTVPDRTITSGPARGRPTGGPTTSFTVTDAQAAALDDDILQVDYRHLGWDSRLQGFVGSGPYLAGGRTRSGPTISATPGRAQILALLDSAASTVDRSAVYDGSPAIEITGDVGGEPTSYWVAPRTDAPLQEVQRFSDRVGGRTDHAVETTRFVIDRSLTGAAASPSLVSLSAAHPAARVDDSLSDWNAANARLLPGS